MLPVSNCQLSKRKRHDRIFSVSHTITRRDRTLPPRSSEVSDVASRTSLVRVSRVETIAHNSVRRVAPLLRELELDPYPRLIGKIGNETPVTVPLSSQASLSEKPPKIKGAKNKGVKKNQRFQTTKAQKNQSFKKNKRFKKQRLNNKSFQGLTSTAQKVGFTKK